jgi:trimeric autotransporter adhesin
MQRVMKFGGLAAAPLTLMLLGGCGGFFASSTTIVSLAVSPTGTYILPNGVQQYTATATYGNNSTGDVTSEVTWTSSAPTIATIDSAGLATGVALGTTTITATSTNNVIGTASLTVSSTTVTGLTISPASASISLSEAQTQQFIATATFSNGTFSNVTSQVTWSSTVPTVATINTGGLASPVALGSTVIGASFAGQTATADLTVTQ